MRCNDAVSGGFLILFGTAVLIHIRTFPAVPGQNYGPALLPGVVATGMIVCGVLLAWGARGQARIPWVAWGERLAEPRQRLRLAAAPAGILFYMIASPTLGFIPTCAVLLAALMRLLGAGWLAALTASAATTTAMYLIFAHGLMAPLPPGLLRGLVW
jgi:putative tricarboxylic transport membrane protein